MTKKRYFSTNNDFKTGIFWKILLIVGFVLLISSVIINILDINEIGKDTSGIILAFSILFLGGGFLVYFISRQFLKLKEIADDIEKEEDA